MRAKKVFETANFKRGGDIYDTLGIGHHGIKKAILLQGFPEVDSMEGDSSREWFQNGGIPPDFLEEIEYNPSDPLSFTDYAGFDEDWYIENELSEHVDSEEFLAEFQPVGPKKRQANTNKWGTFIWQEGRLPDGTRVYHYQDGMNSGFLSKREWLKG
jgi:hypothetical protein